MSRHGLRGILILIILGTIPCYILGFGILLFVPDGEPPTTTPSVIENTATDVQIVLTARALTSRPTFVLPQITPIIGITQIQPSPIPFSTPIASMTPIPTNTAFPTAIPAPNTASPTATEPILLPPTDTPAP